MAFYQFTYSLCSVSQFVVLLYLLTYVGVLTNGLTLVIAGESDSLSPYISYLHEFAMVLPLGSLLVWSLVPLHSHLSTPTSY